LRILFVANDFTDFLQDGLYHGLATILGPENVFDYPPIPRYHGGAGQLPFAFAFPEPPKAKLDDLVAESDAIVLASLREGALETVRRIIDLRSGRPTAFIDGEDFFYVRGIARHVDLYFKREVLISARYPRMRMPARMLYHRLRGREHWADPLRRHIAVAHQSQKNVIPLPFGIVDVGFVPPAETKYDIALIGLPTSPERALVGQELNALSNAGYRVYLGPENGIRIPWPEYMRIMGSSRIGVSVQGLGYDTYRYWEIPYAGTLLLAETPQIVIPGNFVADHEAVFAPLKHLVSRARELLEADTKEIAGRGRERVMREHTSVQRAQTVLDRLARSARSSRQRGQTGSGPVTK
jgi:hypothetical protein